MKQDIEIKLTNFLKTRVPFTEACHVVYLLVEIRKILDHKKTGGYPLLRFYADWCVHTEKDKITKQIKAIMENILKEIKRGMLNKSQSKPDPNLLCVYSFISMCELKKEMKLFLEECGLPNDLIRLEEWNSLQEILPSILADQPIIKPCDGIRKFAFTQADRGSIKIEIVYETTPAVYDTFILEGTYKC